MNYIIASYPGGESGTRLNLKNAADTLNFHLFQLFKLFQKKSELGIPNLVKQITIIKTKPKSDLFYKDYYKYSQLKYIYNVPIQIIDYEGTNTCASYDQWLMGIERNKHLDYHLLIEDDYCINPDNYNFDIELIEVYNRYFENKNGYLCSLASQLHGHPYHAAISNGLVHKNITNYITLQKFYDFLSNSHMHVQVSFSQYFLNNNIEIKGINDIYETLFWEGNIINYTVGDTKKQMFVPLQYFDIYSSDDLRSYMYKFCMIETVINQYPKSFDILKDIPITKWKENDLIYAYLSDINPSYIENFRQQEIEINDIHSYLSIIKNNDYMKELGIKIGHRLRMISDIEKYNNIFKLFEKLKNYFISVRF